VVFILGLADDVDDSRLPGAQGADRDDRLCQLAEAFHRLRDFGLSARRPCSVGLGQDHRGVEAERRTVGDSGNVAN